MGGMQWKDTNSGSLSQGDVLVASPEMADPNFARSLVYLHKHGTSGTLGFVLNRPLGRTLGETLPKADLPEKIQALDLFLGGPVQSDQLVMTLFRWHPGTNGFHAEMTVEPSQLEAAMADPACEVRAFLGYAGWGEGQLAEEIERRDWLWTAPDVAMVRGPSPRMWELLVQGDDRWRKVRDYIPSYPEWN